MPSGSANIAGAGVPRARPNARYRTLGEPKVPTVTFGGLTAVSEREPAFRFVWCDWSVLANSEKDPATALIAGRQR